MKIKGYCIGLLGLLLVACQREEVVSPWETGGSDGDLQLQLSTKGLMNYYVVTTKGTDVKTSEEQEIKTLHVFLFDEDGNYLKAKDENRYQNYIAGGRIVINIDRQGWEDEEKASNATVVVVANVEDGTFQYLYYDDSINLKRLLIYPYAQLSVVFVFILIAFLALISTKKAEQNKVWVGLSKETAHQLGTPISSLIAWVEYLRTKELDPVLLAEMDKDVKRLQTIAERFSKIGSDPDPVPTDILESIRTALGYMQTRISSKVKIHTHLPEKPIWVLMNDSLFAWVIENLIKNAVDAMEGQGEITLRVEEKDKSVWIDLTDTGRGIPKSKYKTVFNPGYTTKARGWGLGLSLVKRIIESLQDGKIFVKSSEIGKGTTFRIKLRKYKS